MQASTSYPASAGAANTTPRSRYHDLILEDKDTVPRGPNPVERFVTRAVDVPVDLSGWSPSFEADLRALALSHWLGSEYDIALIAAEEPADSPLPATRVITVFDDRVHQTVEMVTGATWDPWNTWHAVDRKVNYAKLTAYLLTYYNAVFHVGGRSGKTRVCFQPPVPNRPGEVIQVNGGSGVTETFHRCDHWREGLDDLFRTEPSGADPVADDVSVRVIPYEDHLDTWAPPHRAGLRQLALEHWAGTEADVALVRRAPGEESPRVLRFTPGEPHPLDLRLAATWNPRQGRFDIGLRGFDHQLIKHLLCGHNAVFYDDVRAGESFFYYRRNPPHPPGEEIRVEDGGCEIIHRKETAWNSYLDFIYSRALDTAPPFAG